MKKYVTLGLIAIANMAFAQTNFIGNYVTDSNGYQLLHIVKWNANTGAILADKTTEYETVLLGSNTYDAFNGNYYIRVTNTGTGISTYAKYNLATNNLDTISNASAMTTGAEIDMSTGKIYNITNYNNDLACTQYEIANNNLSLVTSLSNEIQIYNAKSTCFNSNSKKMYVIGNNNGNTNISTIDIATGNVQTIALTDQNLPLATEMQFDNTTNTIYAICNYFINNSKEIKILTINPTTGLVTVLNNLSSNYDWYQNGTVSFNQAGNSIIFTAILTNQERHLINWNVTTNTFSQLQYPIGIDSLYLYNFDCDNFAYANSKYKNTTAISNIKVNNSVSITPNPSNGNFKIDATQKIMSLNIYNAVGQLIISEMPKLNANYNLPVGNYFVKTIFSDNSVVNNKVIITQ